MQHHYRLLLSYVLILTGITFLSGTTLLAQDNGRTYNTVAYDSLNPSNIPGRYSALWGYTAPDNREYVLLGGYGGTHIIDISQKPIREVSFIEGPHSGWREMKTYGEYAYVVSEGGGGLQIIYLGALPDTAWLVNSDTTYFRTGHTITQEGDWLYVHGTNVEAGVNQGTMILDVASNKTSPKRVGSYNGGYVHDATIRNDTMYCAMINDGRLDIVYLGADRTSTQFITSIVYPGAGTHNADLSIDGRYIYTTDEVGSTDKTLKVWDRGDINDIVQVKDFSSDPVSIVHNVHVRGTLAFVAWYTAGSRILDISDPSDPVEIGFYDAYPGSRQNYVGNWEVYPYFKSGKICASYMEDGLQVFTFEGAAKGIVSGTVRDSVTGAPLSGVVIEIPELGRTVTSDANGQYSLLAAEGTVNYSARLLNYRFRSGTLELTSAGTSTDILLTPLQLRTVTIQAVDAATGTPIENVAYHVETRTEVSSSAHTNVMSLPVDSTYHVLVGAWGWHPSTITLSAEESGTVVVPLDRGYVDDVELDLGWTLGVSGDEAANGFWERGDPVEIRFTFQNGQTALVKPGDDHTPGDGTLAFMTFIPKPEGSILDIDRGRVTLQSPQMDLTGYSDPYLNVALWYSNDALPFFTVDDRLYLRVSNDGRTTWKDILVLDHGSPDWTEHSIRLRDVVDVTDDMYFRVIASDSLTDGWVDAGMDDFSITEGPIGGLRDQQSEHRIAALSIHPLPVRNHGTIVLDLDAPLSDARLELYNSLGQSVKQIHPGRLSPGTTRIDLDCEGLTGGVYRLVLVIQNGQAISHSFIYQP